MIKVSRKFFTTNFIPRIASDAMGLWFVFRNRSKIVFLINCSRVERILLLTFFLFLTFPLFFLFYLKDLQLLSFLKSFHSPKHVSNLQKKNSK